MNCAAPTSDLECLSGEPDSRALESLTQQARQDWQRTRYPANSWVPAKASPDGAPLYNVVIVGAGQSGIAAAASLARHRVDPLLVIDRKPEGLEGPWLDFARMPTLRSGKAIVGLDQGLASLTAETWFRAAYGDEAWVRLEKIPTADWVRYVLWVRRTLEIPVRNEVGLRSFSYYEEKALLRLELEGAGEGEHIWARRLVFANGIEGSGEWAVPEIVSRNLSPERYGSTSSAVDFSQLKGKRLGVLGAGASAFDNAGTALEAGAARVDLFYRRKNLPRVNPNRWMENAGFLSHYASMSDAQKWKFYYHYWSGNQPPTQAAFDRCAPHANFHLHPGSNWKNVSLVDDTIKVETESATHEFDYLICATGIVFDLRRQAPLAPFADQIATWDDRYAPPEELQHEGYASMPYVGSGFEFLSRHPGGLPWEGKVFCFNSGANLSLGIVGSAISGLKFGLRFLVEGVGRSFFHESSEAIFEDMLAYDEPELTAPDNV